VTAVRRIVEAAPDLGIGMLTLFAFSSDNWRRPVDEVGALMLMLRVYLQTEVTRLKDNGVRLSVIGRRDRLPDGLAEAIGAAEQATAEAASRSGLRLHLRIALDYSARDAILHAAAACAAQGTPSRASFSRLLSGQGIGADRDVDLLIRPGGEKRLSDFLLWEAAYAELVFSDRMWPDFGPGDLGAAVEDFRSRSRRFGGLAEASGTPSHAAGSVAA
jgi:undecaprenyl diphosphate synthase